MFDHGDRAGVVADHQIKEHAVEVVARGGGQGGHLFRGGHALHTRVTGVGAVAHVGGVRIVSGRDSLAALGQPGAHESHLVGLGGADARRHLDDLGGVGAVGHQGGHVDSLLVVDDHALHEGDVVVGIAVVGDARRVAGLKGAAGLAGGAGLDDGGVLGLGRAGGQQDGQGATREKTDGQTLHFDHHKPSRS